MYVIVAGGGKIGENVTRSLLRLGHEVTLIEQRRDRFEQLEDEFEHQVPEHDVIHMLELRVEILELVVVQIDGDSPSAGRSVEALSLPEGSLLFSLMRDRRTEIAVGSTVLEAGDQVLAILESGKEDEL